MDSYDVVRVTNVGIAGTKTWLTALRSGTAVLSGDGLRHAELEQTGPCHFFVGRMALKTIFVTLFYHAEVQLRVKPKMSVANPTK